MRISCNSEGIRRIKRRRKNLGISLIMKKSRIHLIIIIIMNKSSKSNLTIMRITVCMRALNPDARATGLNLLMKRHHSLWFMRPNKMSIPRILRSPHKRPYNK
jgi:hypothetical protein